MFSCEAYSIFFCDSTWAAFAAKSFRIFAVSASVMCCFSIALSSSAAARISLAFSCAAVVLADVLGACS